MDADDRDPEAPSPPARAPLARVTLAKRPVVAPVARPVRVIEVEARVPMRQLPRAAVVGGSVWVIAPELAVEEIPLGD
ncbi:MAG: hypothetical protein U0325_11255 [Polyangiales bacterium]